METYKLQVFSGAEKSLVHVLVAFNYTLNHSDVGNERQNVYQTCETVAKSYFNLKDSEDNTYSRSSNGCFDKPTKSIVPTKLRKTRIRKFTKPKWNESPITTACRRKPHHLQATRGKGSWCSWFESYLQISPVARSNMSPILVIRHLCELSKDDLGCLRGTTEFEVFIDTSPLFLKWKENTAMSSPIDMLLDEQSPWPKQYPLRLTCTCVLGRCVYHPTDIVLSTTDIKTRLPVPLDPIIEA